MSDQRSEAPLADRREWLEGLKRDLSKLVERLAEDLRRRAAELPEVDRALREAHGAAVKRRQSAEPFDAWREDYLTQTAVAWALGCVFVRYLEDNGLVEEHWLAGEGEGRREAEGRHEEYFREHPHESDREYFQQVFRRVGALPAARDLFAEGKTPLWAVGPSGDEAMRLLAFLREIDGETGALKRNLEAPEGDTRFLGDLYQHLSESARKKYALLQTPEFVEEFILDRTLTPALEEFGLEKVRLIDPTCGSGHFLLGAFGRLFDLWTRREPGTNPRELAQRALSAVHGIDLNPFAVSIARFRLLIAALEASGVKRLKDAPGFKMNVATGDSLLLGPRWKRSADGIVILEDEILWEEEWLRPILGIEEPKEVIRILSQQYHVVVGNPPYINVDDKALRQSYRDRYKTCSGKYSLGVPFTERFFELAVPAEDGRSRAGYIGMITTNSFMKREFGKKLIEVFLKNIDLTHVIDTSGAYIPGHGTPTVILFGRNRPWISETIRAALGIRGEPSTPEDPTQGKVWRSIVEHIDRGEAQNEFITVTDVPRSSFAKHPWSVGGGGAGELKEQIERYSNSELSSVLVSIGFASFPGLDDSFLMDISSLRRKGILYGKVFVHGESIRDWGESKSLWALAPYGADYALIGYSPDASWARHLWCFRTSLENIISFGGKNRKELGDRWWGWYRWVAEKYRTPLSIAFAFVATHNHFVLDRGGKVFNRSAPIIKLPVGASEEEHLGLLGLLNSSTACFWMKQVFSDKGNGGIGGGIGDEAWERRYEIAGTGLLEFPVSEVRPFHYSARLDSLAQRLADLDPETLVQKALPTRAALDDALMAAEETWRTMIALQEELDWECYRLYGLIEEDLRSSIEPPPLQLGERAFEIVLARKVAAGETTTAWFERHSATPITEVPGHWPEGYRKLIERRIALIETDPHIGLIERPEYKRRWSREPWEDREERALKSWLLDRLESEAYWPRSGKEREVQSTAQLAEKAARDREFLQVAGLYRKREDFDLGTLVTELVLDEAVPFLPVLRYKESGLRKREAWEHVWDLQRREDRGEKLAEPIPVPPNYAKEDFRKGRYWDLRGKLDVPKERFILYPDAERAADPTPVVGWAGWDHREQASALAAFHDRMKSREGWDAARLQPLLLGIAGLVPWLLQWHNDPDPALGGLRVGEFFREFLETESRSLGLTVADLKGYRPPERVREKAKRAKRAKKT